MPYDIFYDTTSNHLEGSLELIKENTIIPEGCILTISKDEYEHVSISNTYQESYKEISFEDFYKKIKELLNENYDLTFKDKDLSIQEKYESLINFLNGLNPLDLDGESFQIGIVLKK